MLQLKYLLKEFLKCEIDDVITISFWYDSWSDFGPLIEYIGSEELRNRKEACFAEVVKHVVSTKC